MLVVRISKSLVDHLYDSLDESKVSYITPARLNSLNTIAMQIMLIRIPMGPLLIFEEGLNPKIGSALSANFSSISPMGFTRTWKRSNLMKLLLITLCFGLR